MNYNEVNTEGKALAYLLDCTLATVESLAITKSRKQYEYKRQISIAQTTLDWCRQFGVDVSKTRAKKIIEGHQANVIRWTESFEVKK